MVWFNPFHKRGLAPHRNRLDSFDWRELALEQLAELDRAISGASTATAGIQTTRAAPSATGATLPTQFQPHTSSVGGAQSSSTPAATRTTGTSLRPLDHATSTATSSPQQTSPSGLSTGAKAGIGVGAAIGGLLLIALGAFGAIWFLRRSRQRDNGRAPVMGGEGGSEKREGTGGPHELDHDQRAKEMATGKEAHEAPARPAPAELRGSPGYPQNYDSRYELPVK